jgi:hypothetical protein
MKISVGSGYQDWDYGHTCVIYSPSISCFFIPFNDSNVCNGNGNILKNNEK